MSGGASKLGCMARTLPEPPDPLLRLVCSVRDLVGHVVRSATWAQTLACACAFASRLLWPLVPDDVLTHVFLVLSAISLGACVGRPIDRRLAQRRGKS